MLRCRKSWTKEAEMPSAVWEVVGLDWLMLHKDTPPTPGWRVRTLWLGDPLSLQIAKVLEDQLFRTRREALRAIEAARLSLQDREPEDE